MRLRNVPNGRLFSNHKEKEFQKSLKLLESEAPAGFLRGQGALVSSSPSTSDPSSLFGLQPTSSAVDADVTYKSLPGSRMSGLGGNAGPGTNQCGFKRGAIFEFK